MPKPAFAAALIILALAACPAAAADAPDRVWIENLSEPTDCAAFDNVTVVLINPKIRSFEIEASAPVYAPDLKDALAATSLENCAPQPAPPPPPKPVTLYEDAETRVTGLESASAQGPEIIVGDKRAARLGLVTLAVKRDGAFREALAFNPLTGLWLARPAAPDGSPIAVYGSGFLVGPMENTRRPAVAIARLKIDAKARAFRMTFAGGGVGELRIDNLDANRIVLKATLDGLPESDPPKPFAALRSMFVGPTNANVARVNWRGEKGLYNEPVMEFKGANAGEVRFDRIEIAKQKPGTPDLTFRAFGGAEPPAR